MKNYFPLPAGIILVLTVFINLSFSQWIITNGPPEGNTFPAMASNAGNVYVSNYGYVMPLGIYRTTNNGGDWSLMTPFNRVYYSIAATGSALFAGSDSGIYKSFDNGYSWTRMGMQSLKVISVYQYGNYLFAGTNAGIYRADTVGTSWISCGLTPQVIYGFTSNSTYLFAANFSDNGVPVYRTSNNGLNWTEIGTGYRPLCLASIGSSYVFEGSTQGLLRSTDNGNEWWHVTGTNVVIRCLMVKYNTVFAGTDNGLYVSTNNGTNWEVRNEGLTSGVGITSFTIFGNDIYAGIDYSKVWKRPVSQITSLNENNGSVPSGFYLYENYPNPFNPSTVIKFKVAEKSFVKVSVFDILSREVSVLVNENLAPGMYETYFSADNLPAGVYFCRLTAGEFSQTRRIALVK